MPMWRLWLLSVLLIPIVTPALAAPRVAASLAPIHSLVAAVMQGVGQPALLIQAGALPEGYVVPVPTRQALAAADIVFWLGEPADLGLAPAIAARGPSLRVLDLSTAIAPARPARSADAAVPHAWLDPANAALMAAAIAANLASADPADTGRYRANAAALAERLHALDSEIAAQVRPLATRPALVFADALQAFEARYGLAAVEPVIIRPEWRRHLGGIDTGRLLALRAGWRRSGAGCIGYEPQADREFVDLLVDATDIAPLPIDPFGTGLPAGPGHYERTLRQFAVSLAACLERGRPPG